MTAKARATLLSDIATAVNDNTTGDISAADVRGELQDLADSAFNLLTDFMGFGEARLTKSGANLLLSRYSGPRLFIDGLNYLVPVAGVTLAPPATTLTLYYIYAFMSAGTMTLEASTTAPATDATYGHQIKTGDATRTLVGMARTVSSAWVDSATQIFVLSYFNRKKKAGRNVFSTTRTTTSATYVELNTEIRVEFLSWADDAIFASLTAYVAHSGANATTQSSIGIDGTTALGAGFASGAQHYLGTALVAHAAGGDYSGLAVGYHYATLLGLTSGATATWQSSVTGIIAGVMG